MDLEHMTKKAFKIIKPTYNGTIYLEKNIAKLENGIIGIGEVTYDEGSQYFGFLRYENTDLHKIGLGIQDFTKSSIKSCDVGGLENWKLYRFIGNFDFKVNGWIYGNGVLYFLDQNDKPVAFIKGFFSGLTVINKYKGDFEQNILLPGFTMDMEISQKIRRSRYVELLKLKPNFYNVKTILIGDSWFEFYENNNQYGYVPGTFKEDSNGKSVLNLGIGGATYHDFIEYIPTLCNEISFQNVIINLGFNDIHCGYSVSKIYNDFSTVIKLLRNLNPNCNIYVLGVSPSVLFKNTLSKEIRLNNLLSRKIKNEYENIKFISCTNIFMKDKNTYFDDFESLYTEDGVHLNKKGYLKWTNLFKKYF